MCLPCLVFPSLQLYSDIYLTAARIGPAGQRGGAVMQRVDSHTALISGDCWQQSAGTVYCVYGVYGACIRCTVQVYGVYGVCTVQTPRRAREHGFLRDERIVNGSQTDRERVADGSWTDWERTRIGAAPIANE